MDDTFQIYVNRVARLTLPESYRTQLQHIQTSPKYRIAEGGAAGPLPFPGYSIVTPPWIDDVDNGDFYEQVRDLQQQLLQALPPGLLIPVPAESFHVTLADLFWDSAYRDANRDPGFEPQLRDRIAQIFEEYAAQHLVTRSVYWQVLGLAVRARAISVCLAPKDEAAYEQVVTMRRAIFQNSALMGLGMEQQYHLTAHITLGYFGEIPGDLDREAVSEDLNQLSLNWLGRQGNHSVWVHHAELRKFDDMTHYYREPDWATLEL